MKLIFRGVILVCCFVLAVEALVLYDATGRAGYTRHFDPTRASKEKAASGQSLNDLFADTGLDPLDEPAPNRFQLGLAPSAYPWQIADKHFISVATIAGPALLIALLTLLLPALERRKRKRRSAALRR